MDPVLLVIVLVGLAVALRLLAGAFDRHRIHVYVGARGGRVLSIRWNPFGRGWFGEKDSRIYEVRFRDLDGTVHRTTCKTGLFSGVYFTEDAILRRPARSDPDAGGTPLLEENRRLRWEIERLKRQRG